MTEWVIKLSLLLSSVNSLYYRLFGEIEINVQLGSFTVNICLNHHQPNYYRSLWLTLRCEHQQIKTPNYLRRFTFLWIYCTQEIMKKYIYHKVPKSLSKQLQNGTHGFLRIKKPLSPVRESLSSRVNIQKNIQGRLILYPWISRKTEVVENKRKKFSWAKTSSSLVMAISTVHPDNMLHPANVFLGSNDLRKQLWSIKKIPLYSSY